MKKISLILWITIFFLIFGCTSKNLPEVTIDEIINNDEYYISEVQWLNNEEILLKIGKAETNNDENNMPTYKMYVFDAATKSGTLLYEGYENEYYMDGNTLTLVDDHKMYVYNAEYCLEFNDRKMVKNYNLKETFDKVFGEEMYEGTSLNINREGVGSLLYNGDIITFSLDDIENYEVFMPQTSELVDAEKVTELSNAGVLDDYKEIPATYYYQPLWSPDGKWLLYNERDILEGHDSTVIMQNTTDNEKKAFDFKYMDYYQWADTSDYVVACTWPTHAAKPEIKVYNLGTNECKSFVLDEPIDNISFQRINVLDVNGSKILLSCLEREKSPLLILDFATGEKKWVTEADYEIVNAAISPADISPDQDKIVCYSRNHGIEILDIK